MEDDLIKLNADEMLNRIQNAGKVALYGLFFDFDKATLQEASSETLEQIALLLKNNPKLIVYVVGHTDMKGSLLKVLDLWLQFQPMLSKMEENLTEELILLKSNFIAF